LLAANNNLTAKSNFGMPKRSPDNACIIEVFIGHLNTTISSDVAGTVADATIDFLCCSLGNAFTTLGLVVDGVMGWAKADAGSGANLTVSGRVVAAVTGDSLLQEL
jgi:hypothetical protein